MTTSFCFTECQCCRKRGNLCAGRRWAPLTVEFGEPQADRDRNPDRLWQREDRGPQGLIHHSNKGVQYVALRYTQRLADAGVVASVGTTGDSYDNALAEAFDSLFKAELIRNKGPWTNIDDLEIAVAEYIDWFNHRRLHGEIGLVPPAGYETEHYRHHHAPAAADASVQSLH